MPQHPFSSEPSVDVGGKTFTESGGPQIAEVLVDTDITAANSATITVLDTDRTALNGIDYGSTVTVGAPSLVDGETKELFSGEVYAMEFEADERGTYSRITAFDKTYRLKQHRVSRAHLDVKDSDVVRKLANEVGVPTGDIKDTPIKHEQLGQLNETHWDFLRERAAALDYEMFIDEGKLHFRPPDRASTGPAPGGHDSNNPLQLTSGKNLTHLRTRLTAAQQVSSVEVRGWDPVARKELVATATANTIATELSDTPTKLAGKMGADKQVASRAGYGTHPECNALAKSLAQRSASSYAYAEGTALGDVRLVAGVTVAIGESGPFDGKYMLTRARHVFRPGDYSTHLVMSGNHDRTHFALAGGMEPEQTWPGAYPGIVTDLNDPEKRGRVKLMFPWLDSDYVSDWARVMQIGAGVEEGLLWFPEVDDEVIVMFVGGDGRHPVVLGGLYGGKDKVPFDHLDGGKGAVEIRGMKSREGHQIAFYDKKGEQRIEVKSCNGNYSIVLDEDDKKLVIEAKGGDVEVKASAANVTVESADLTVKGKNITVEASQNLEMKAAANMKLQAGGTVEIKGTLVKLN